MTFYISNEGVILEHSPGYHAVGLEFIGMAFRYMSLLKLRISDEWRQKYEKAKIVLSDLRRPDGSLPMIGDTGSGSVARAVLVTRFDTNGRSLPLSSREDWIPMNPNTLYLDSGYCTWWNGLHERAKIDEINQTIITWSHFPGHGHKHADEMSLSFWAGGTPWWENVGYWPYEDRRRVEAVSWSGSNAPHFIDETAASVRNTTLRFYGSSSYIRVVDLERRVPEGYTIRRQVVALNPSIWIVIDVNIGGSKKQMETIWTTVPQVEIANSSIRGAYHLKTSSNHTSVTAFPLGSVGLRVRKLRGSFTPFAGWSVNNQIPQPSDAIVLEQRPGDSWTAMIWTVNTAAGSDTDFVQPPFMKTWKDAEHWNLVISRRAGVTTVVREGNKINIQHAKHGMQRDQLTLTEGTASSSERDQILGGYKEAQRIYPGPFLDLLSYRIKISGFLGALLLLQEIFFLFYAKIINRYFIALRALSACGWVSMGIWLVLIYFRT